MPRPQASIMPERKKSIGKGADPFDIFIAPRFFPFDLLVLHQSSPVTSSILFVTG
jgi:hypothetical protein